MWKIHSNAHGQCNKRRSDVTDHCSTHHCLTDSPARCCTASRLRQALWWNKCPKRTASVRMQSLKTVMQHQWTCRDTSQIREQVDGGQSKMTSFRLLLRQWCQTLSHFGSLHHHGYGYKASYSTSYMVVPVLL